MNIKSLLLGSAAALFAVSGASAADAIIAAEPEPVEYVRVCDAFGTGYFYIPGTETCLKISGFARFRVDFDSNDDSYNSTARGRLNIQAKEDTEMGLLHAYLRIQADTSPNAEDGSTSSTSNTYGYDGNAVFDQAYLELGGLIAGYTENSFVNSKNGGASGFGSHTDDGLAYGDGQANQIGYNFTGANWFAAISANDDGDAASYTPDFTGRVGGVWGGMTVYVAAGYDQSAENFGVKIGLNTDIGTAGNLIVQGFYADGPTVYSAATSAPAFGASMFTPEWSVLGSYQHTMSSTLTASIGGQYSADYYTAPITGYLPLGSANSGMDSWAVEGSLVWTPVANFEVRSEIKYIDFNQGGGDATRGMFWLQRSF
ncbi:MAG: porin [Rhizobiaceae bacterium]|nr:porin [Rhizobiaceae bacterium]